MGWRGGGIFSQNSELTLIHVTVARNSVLSDMQASGLIVLHYLDDTTSTADIQYSIFADHRMKVAVMAQTAGDVVNLDHTLFYDNRRGDYGSQAGLPPGVINHTNEVPSGDPEFLSSGLPDYDYHIGENSAARDQAMNSTSVEDIDADGRPVGREADVGADECCSAE